MSTALAIASVTAVLKDLLNNGLIDHNVSGVVGQSVLVSSLPPDRIATDPANEKSQLNLFLYQVTPNAGWRNVGQPSRDGRGDRLTNPPLALDLHYLLTAYGEQELHTEILLGYGMQLLHETPVLTRDAIRRSLVPADILDPGDLPPALQGLYASGLAEQVEQVKICPMSISTEEISRLWSAFQAKYRPTAAYQATVVLIESRSGRARSGLPVRERNVYAVPFAQPFIEEVLSQENDLAPVVAGQPILAGHNLILAGRQLRSDDTRVNAGGIEVTPLSGDITPARVKFQLPAALLAGVQGAQVVQYRLMGTPENPHVGLASNVAAFVLRPTVTSATAFTQPGSGPNLLSGTINLQVTPPVGREQRVLLLLNELNPPAARPPFAYSFEAPSPYQLIVPPQTPPPTDGDFGVPIRDVQTGTYLVRVQVDGAESPLETGAGGKYVKPAVDIV
ncbi:MAG TPA: DUF4255 domain-containing protein [Pyrinomonadaceae bacterium]|jgi:hypothetical protein